jgi:CubicO group peptidase (beta-lactamase class C family)
MTSLPRSTPSATGTDAAGILALIDAMEQARIELHSLMIVRHGEVIAEGWWHPYDAATPHLLYSLSKSFTSMAAGIAQAEGLLHVDDLLSAHLTEAQGYPATTIRDALRMSTGHLTDPALDPASDASDPATSGDAVTDAELRTLLESYLPERAPGEVYTYDQLATFAVAKIVEQASGRTLIDYLRPRLLDPLGASEAAWLDWGGNPGFSGLHLGTESIAAFGQLLLQHGRWQVPVPDGSLEWHQLVPAEYVEQATRVQMVNDSAHRFPAGQPVEPDWAVGYGYQFWMSRHGYRGDGAYGQLCLVLPEHDAVVAVTACTSTMEAVLEAAWEHLLPAFDGMTADARADDASADDASADEDRTVRAGADEARADEVLAARMRALAVPPLVAGLPRLAAATAEVALATVAEQVVAARGQLSTADGATAAADIADSDDPWTALAAGMPVAMRRARQAAGEVFGSGAVVAPVGERNVAGIRFTRSPLPADRPGLRFGGVGSLDLPEIIGVRLDGDTLVLETAEHGEARLTVGGDRAERGSVPSILPVPFAVRGGWAPDGICEIELRMIQTPHTAYLALDPSTGTFTITWREPTLHGRGLTGYAVQSHGRR